MNPILANTAAFTAIATGLVAIVGLMLADYWQSRPARYLFKPIAALAFVSLALCLGATSSVYGTWLLAGLVACLVGDLCLMPDRQDTFLAGLAAFLCGHLLYVVAFMHLGINAVALLIGAVPALLLLFFSTRWLRPHLPPGMKLPVYVYMLVITAMLLAACLTTSNPSGIFIVCGAWGFAMSDLAVARQQFVQPTRRNGLWGTPLYFGSQLLLATTPALT